MPAPIALAHHLTLAMAKERKSGAMPWMRPDGKSQVTVEYDENGNVSWCPTIVISTQHDPDIAIKDLREAIVEQIIRPTLPKELIRPEHPASSSTPPAVSWSAALWATPA